MFKALVRSKIRFSSPKLPVTSLIFIINVFLDSIAILSLYKLYMLTIKHSNKTVKTIELNLITAPEITIIYILVNTHESLCIQSHPYNCTYLKDHTWQIYYGHLSFILSRKRNNKKLKWFFIQSSRIHILFKSTWNILQDKSQAGPQKNSQYI